MRTVGMIVEYNPLHYGHVHHLEQSKQVSGADAVVAVMSGHFLQRGEPAIVDKWTRAEMALRMGVDLVLELPVVYATQPAEWFAYGAVSALHRTGVVDALCFGSESGELDWMRPLARLLKQEPTALKAALQAALKTGVSYPAAFSEAVAKIVPGVDPAALSQPNNTLGLHYLIALERLASPIDPLTIPRVKAGYNDTSIADERIASATALRKLMAGTRFGEAPPSELSRYVPESTFTLLEREFAAGRGPLTWEHFARPLFHQLLSLGPEALAEFHEVEEGLEHRIHTALASMDLQYFPKVDALLEQLKTKRYTRTKLQRTLLRILLQHRRSLWDRHTLRSGVPYLRVLGFTSTGRELLKRMKRTATVPVVTKIAGLTDPVLALDIRATSAYALGYQHLTRDELLRDYYQAPIQVV